jgi:hypothetical protein
MNFRLFWAVIGVRLIFASCIALSACATRQPSAPEASTAAVSQSVSTATDSTMKAQQSVADAKTVVSDARSNLRRVSSYSDRIDAKAVIILNNWR